MKLGMLTQWFDPETGPAALPGVYAREMIRQGHEVTVLTGHPNYPNGRLYDGYVQYPRRTSREAGLTVTRVPLYPSHNSSSLGRVANYASFAASAASLGARALAATEAVWVYNSPVSVALPLMTETSLGRKPYFLHIQDLWPDSLIHSKMLPQGRVGSFIAARVSSVVRAMEKHSARIGVISPSVRNLILERNPNLDPAKILYVPNPTDEQIFTPLLREAFPNGRQYPWGRKFSVMYLGAVGEAQGLDTVLDAAKLLPADTDIQIVIVGDGTAKRRLLQRVEREKIHNVLFRDRVAKSIVPELMASADVQLVSLANDEFLKYTTPSKISSIMASALPIIAQLSGDGADLIEKAGAGATATPGDPHSLVAAISTMASSGPEALKRYGESGFRYYLDHLSVEASSTAILRSLEDALSS